MVLGVITGSPIAARKKQESACTDTENENSLFYFQKEDNPWRMIVSGGREGYHSCFHMR